MPSCKSTPCSPHSTPPRVRTCESLHLDWLWPLPTSMARREHQLWVSGVRWWVGRVRFCVQKGWISLQINPILASFDIIPSPHMRITAPRLVAALAHIHGEAATPALGVWSAVVGRKGPVLCAEGVDFHANRPHPRLIRHHPVSAHANHCT